MQDMLNALEDRLDTLNRAGAETTEKVDVLIGIANALGSNNSQRVRRLAQEAYDLAGRLAYPQGQGHGLACLAFAAYIESDLETAYTHFKAALEVFETLDDPHGKARVLGRLALLQMSLGDYEQSLASGLEAVKLARQHGDVMEQAGALTVCGTGYSDLGAYDRALQYFEEAEALLEDGADDVIKARALSGMGTVYHKKGDYEKALNYHQQSLALFKAKGNHLGEARVLNDLGIIHTHLGHEEDALDYHQRSLRIREMIGHRQSQSTSLIHLGNLYLQRGEVEPALEHLHRALAIAEAIKVRLRIYQAHLGLAEAYERQGRLAEALDHHKAYHRVREEVMGEEARIKLNNMQIRFEVEKAEQAAEIERLRNVELKEKNDELQRVLQELKTTQAQLIHSEKLASLGQLTAGIAHELNNPAAAVQRGAKQLQSSLTKSEQSGFKQGVAHLSPAQLKILETHTQLIAQRATEPLDLDPLSRSDQEYEIEIWLKEQGVEGAWELAPVLVNSGYNCAKLSELAGNFSSEEFRAVMALLSNTYTARNLLAEVGQGTDRIIEIVKALKSYSYLDQAPIQSVDIHEGLDNTLVMLRSKLKAGLQVQRDYAPDLPRIEAYGSELNQVWTNIIDNAVSAMNGQGEITLRTYRQDAWVVVEIKDTGSGIPPNIQAKIFDPFFTTKPPGEGAGLGLNICHNIIVQKHKGKIAVYSKPGETRFEIKLPLNFEAR